MTAYQVTVVVVAGVQEWQPNVDRDELTSTDEQPPWQQSGYQHLNYLDRVRGLDQQPDQFLALPNDVPYLQLCVLTHCGVATSAQAERRLHRLTNQSGSPVEYRVL